MATESMTSLRALSGRIVWMLLGPALLAVCALTITQRKDGWLTPLSLIYFLVLGGMLLGRWVESQYSQPLTATGEPATAAHLRRYAVALGILGVGIWVVANVVGSHAARFFG